MSINVSINRFRAHSAFAKNKLNPENLPRRMTQPEEITSISALFSVQKYCAKIEEIIQNMRKLCPLREMNFFFTSYAEYKNRISSIVDQSNMILRKLSPTFQHPTYQTGEDLRSYHEDFLTAVSHLNLQKQPVYFNAVTELMNKLPLDLDKFLQKYRKNAQVRQYLLTFEPKFREKIRNLDQDIRTILLPIEFEHLDFDKVYGLVERLRSIHRTFEITLMTTVKQRYGTEKRKSSKDLQSLNSSFPLVKETEWNSTIITLIPILSNLPMFIENSNSLNESIPDLTMSIEKLCLEIDDLLPRCEGFEEVLPKKSSNVNETDDKVEKILQKASTILDMNLNRDQSKVDKLDAVVGEVENTINQLKSQINEVTKEKEKVKLDYDKTNIVNRFTRIRQASDDIAKKFENDKENFLMTVIDKLRLLIDFNFSLDEKDPYRMFNAVYKQLCKEFDQLKSKNSLDKSINNNHSNTNNNNRNNISSNQNNTKSNQNNTNNQNNSNYNRNNNNNNNHDNTNNNSNSNQNNPNSNHNNNNDNHSNTNSNHNNNDNSNNTNDNQNNTSNNSNNNHNNTNGNQNNTNNSQNNNIDSKYRDAFIELCAKITNKDKSYFFSKTPDELQLIVSKAFDENKNDDLGLIDIDKLMSLVPVKSDKDYYLDILKNKLKKMDYTLEAIEPFNSLTSKLNNMLDSNESCFLPTSNTFSEYLDSVSKMKDNLTKINPELMHKPIHSMIVQSVELFNSLAIRLASASFAPEFADNQKSIQTILKENQNLNLSLARLRILLEEKDEFLQAETRKLAKLEKQFSVVVKENQNSNESVDTQKLIQSIETRESESDFF